MHVRAPARRDDSARSGLSVVPSINVAIGSATLGAVIASRGMCGDRLEILFWCDLPPLREMVAEYGPET